MAELKIEQVRNNTPAALKTPYSASAMLIWAALVGGSEEFDKDPEWVLRQLGRDAKLFAEVATAARKEFESFQRFNGVAQEPDKEGNQTAQGE